MGPLPVQATSLTGVVGQPDEPFAVRGPALPPAGAVRLSQSRMPAGAFVERMPGKTNELLAVAGILGVGCAGAPEIAPRPRGAADLWGHAGW
jgi:hypothetical protein